MNVCTFFLFISLLYGLTDDLKVLPENFDDRNSIIFGNSRLIKKKNKSWKFKKLKCIARLKKGKTLISHSE